MKQRRATKSSFRSNKHCLFPSQDPRCCTFHASLSRISCNCDVPVLEAWLISEQTWAWRKERAKWGHSGALAKQEVTQHAEHQKAGWHQCGVWKWCLLQPHRARRSEKKKGGFPDGLEWIAERSCCPSALRVSFCPAELLLHHHSCIWVTGQQHVLQHHKYLPREVPSFLLPPICIGKMRKGAWQEGMVGLYAALCSWQGKGKKKSFVLYHIIKQSKYDSPSYSEPSD